MELTQTVLKRRMVRHFTDEPVLPEAIEARRTKPFR